MAADMQTAWEPRKTPVQARAAITVQAICEATIQVLLKQGAAGLTTTRVAERAGVSVGTLYQYYPNKRSLLFAVLENHLNKVCTAVEEACRRAGGEPLHQMMREVVETYVNAKMERRDISIALYQIAGDVGGAALVVRTALRTRKALDAMLQTAPDIGTPPDKLAVGVMTSAMAGAMRSMLEAGASAATVGKQREYLVLLCQSYMAAVTGGSNVGMKKWSRKHPESAN